MCKDAERALIFCLLCFLAKPKNANSLPSLSLPQRCISTAQLGGFIALRR